MLRRLLVAAALTGIWCDGAYAQISNNPRLLASFRDIVAPVRESTVRIRGDDKDIALGAIISPDGLILTKASELRGTITVRFADGTEYPAHIRWQDRTTDLAILHAESGPRKPIRFAQNSNAPIGAWVVAAGIGTEPVAVGVVSAVTRKPTGADAIIDNLNRGYLGIVMSEDPTDEEGNVIGAKIASIEPKSGAAMAGLKVGDIILAVNGKKTPGRMALRDALEDSRPDQKVTLTVKRGDQVMEVEVTLTKAPKIDRSDFQNRLGGELSGRRTGFPLILQTDMFLKPSDCGGPVIDLDGNVLGLCIARAGRVETHILPVEVIRPILENLKAGKLMPATAPTPRPKN